MMQLSKCSGRHSRRVAKALRISLRPRTQVITCSSPSPAGAAAAAQGAPPILRIPPSLLAAGGLDPYKDGPEAAEKFGSHLSNNYMAVNSQFEGTLRVLNIEPPVVIIQDFLSSQQCDNLIASAHGSEKMQQSGVGGHNVDNMKDIRTSRTLAMTSELLKQHPELSTALEPFLSRVRELLPGAPHASVGSSQFAKPSMPGQVSFELPQIAHYTQGQHFLSHEDAFPPDIARQKGYQRRATLLVYLNDVDQGGQTKFDYLGFGVQPKKGQALVFFPSHSWCAPDKRTLHTAEDATDDKWICQLWLSSGLPKQQPLPGQKSGKIELPAGLKAAKRGNPGPKTGRRGGKNHPA